MLSTILSFNGDPLQTSLLGKDIQTPLGKDGVCRTVGSMVENRLHFVKVQPLKRKFAADAAIKNINKQSIIHFFLKEIPGKEIIN